MSFSKKLASASVLSLSLLASTAFAQDTTPENDTQPANNNVETNHFQCDAVPPASRHPLIIDPNVSKSVAPATVFIQNKAAMRMPFGIVPETDTNLPKGGVPGSTGSGFIIDPSGIVVTNSHVLGGNKEATIGRTFTVTLYDPTKKDSLGEEFETTLIGIEDNNVIDIAVLQIVGVEPGRNFPCVQFTQNEDINITDPVLAIGSPFGQTFTFTAGIISSTNRENSMNSMTHFIQTDAAINPGNSGGPLLTVDGKVAGMNTAIYTPSGGSVGLGFAIPADTITFATNRLLEHGEIKYGWIGTGIETLHEQIRLNLGIDNGVKINDLTPDGPADKAGLENGDIITHVNGLEIQDAIDLKRAIGRVWPGETAQLEIIRGEQHIRIEVEVGDKAPDMDDPSQDETRKGPIIKPDEMYKYDDEEEDEETPDDAKPDGQESTTPHTRPPSLSGP